MNEGVEILLARMDSHPDEFDEHGPWAWVFNAIDMEINARTMSTPASHTRVSFMTDEELDVLWSKFQQLQASVFTNKIMSQLLNPPEELAPKRKIVLTQQQVTTAKQLGLTPAEYAQELVKLKATGKL